MGPVRRGLTLAGACLLALIPLPALAGVCADYRPDWDGGPVSALSEAAALFSWPVSLVLVLATLVAVRFRSQWGALAVCVAWSVLVAGVTFFDITGGVRTAAMAEGCIGPPTLFIAAAGAISVAMILYTAPREKDA